MSGPKTSQYSVTNEVRARLREQALAEQRRQLEEKQREEKRRMEEERQKCIIKGNIKSTISEVNALPNSLSDELNVINVAKESNINVHAFLNDYDRLKFDISNISKQYLLDNLSLSDLQMKEKQILQFKKEILHKVELLKEESRKIYTILDDKLENEIEKGFKLDINETDEIKDNVNKENENSLSEQKNDIIAELSAVSVSQNCSQQLVTEIQEAISEVEKISDYDFLLNYKSITVSRLRKKYEQEQIDIKERELQALVQQKEQTYIADAIDEAMSEMGYEVIGYKTSQRKNGRHFKDELYSFGDGTAVNIRYDSNGQIAMELGALDSYDRLPSSSEQSMLCKQMESFCGKFKELENRLAQKGVIPKHRILMLPPEAEYAQIINIEDYTISNHVDTVKRKRNIKSKNERSINNG